MSAIDGVGDRLDRTVARLPLVDDRTTFFVVAVTALALLFRLVLLGDRLAHFDEGRVAYWALHFMETGEFHYRYIIHGPFLQHANTYVFSVFGSNDFTMRLVVALLGGLLPLAVLFLREHLRETELVGVALFLAFNPILLYYSRFYRSTLPVAAFSFVAFGLIVRFYDTREFRYVHGAVFFVALGFAAKENAAVYLLVWIGASALLLDYGLYRPRNASSGIQWLGSWWSRTIRGRDLPRLLGRSVGHVVLAAILFLVVFVFFYAPRTGTTGQGVDLWNSLATLDLVPLLEATWSDVKTGYEYWFGGGVESGQFYDTILDRYLDFLWVALEALGTYAPALIAFAALGFFVERYGTSRRRNLVMFAGYWGIVSILGYPLGSDISNAWITVNGLIPLAVPAGVGLALLFRWGRESLADDDHISAGLVAVILILVVGWTAVVGGNGVYVDDQSHRNEMVQYAQPADNFRPTLHDVRELSELNDGTDVYVYGSQLVSSGGQMEPGCTDISNTLPLEWYLKSYGANATCGDSETELDNQLADGNPPVIVTMPSDADDVRERLPDYDEREFALRYASDPEHPNYSGRVYFLDTDRLNASA